MATFVIRLTPQEIRNVSVDSVEPSPSVAIQGEPVEIRVPDPVARAAATTRMVEFYIDGVKKGEKPVEIPADGQVEVSFPTPAEPQGGRAAPRRDRAQRGSRPVRGRR